MSATPSSAHLHELVGLVQATDIRLQQLAHDGITGPHHACSGEEPTLVGAAAALEEKDWVFWGSQVCVPALTRAYLRMLKHKPSAAAALRAPPLKAIRE